MAGAAAVAAAFTLIESIAPPFPVTAVLPLAENMVSATSARPGDIYNSLIGKTVEIKNPDAEGRLLLAMP